MAGKGHLMGLISDNIKEFIQGVDNIMEVNNSEYQFLWEKYAYKGTVPWVVSREGGYGVHVGDFHDRPTWIAIRTAVVNGKKILFWHATSLLVDHRLIEKWFRTHLPHIQYPMREDATNNNITLTEEQYRAMYPS
jgi:hypothetical protein